MGTFQIKIGTFFKFAHHLLFQALGSLLRLFGGLVKGGLVKEDKLKFGQGLPIATVISEPYGWHFRRHCALGLCERFA